ncbi:MAG: hypothetical protein QXX94_01455 [Candidatus Bathyarchaeia archaeon]
MLGIPYIILTALILILTAAGLGKALRIIIKGSREGTSIEIYE